MEVDANSASGNNSTICQRPDFSTRLDNRSQSFIQTCYDGVDKVLSDTPTFKIIVLTMVKYLRKLRSLTSSYRTGLFMECLAKSWKGGATCETCCSLCNGCRGFSNLGKYKLLSKICRRQE